MKRIRIIHRTEYHYRVPVTFGPHRALLRPREGHDVHIQTVRLQIEPAADVRWLRDIFGNTIAVIGFSQPGQKLSLLSEVDVDLSDDSSLDCLIDPTALSYPFQYAAQEQLDLIPYRLPSYPHDGPAVQKWLLDLYQPGQLVRTSELLTALNTRIFESFRLTSAREQWPESSCPVKTLASKGTGSMPGLCRVHDGGGPALGFRGAVCDRLYPDGPRTSMALPMPGRRSTYPAPAGADSIPRTTNWLAPNTLPSRWRAIKIRPCRSPATGKVRPTPSSGWTSRCRLWQQ